MAYLEWDERMPGCLPFVNNVYTPSQLGKDNCRVFSAINFTVPFQEAVSGYCANSYGISNPCPGDVHGTLDAEIVLRTCE